MRALVRGLLGCLITGAAVWVVLDLLVWQGALHTRLTRGREGGLAAEAAGSVVTRQELRHALREHLWQRNVTWQALDAAARKEARWQVVKNLVNDRLVQMARLQETGGGSASHTTSMRRESEMMRRQFADTADYMRRLEGQHHTQSSFDAAIQAAQLDEAWLAAQMSAITDDDVKAWYERFKETMRIPAAHHAAHLFLTRHGSVKPDAEVRIRELHRQLVAGEKTFVELVQDRSEDLRTKNKGGDLGWFTRQRMPADFVAAVEKLAVGRLSGPISTTLGWHLVVVRERRPSRLPALAEVRAEITGHLRRQRREDAVKALLDGLRQRHGPPRYHASVIDSAEPLP